MSEYHTEMVNDIGYPVKVRWPSNGRVTIEVIEPGCTTRLFCMSFFDLVLTVNPKTRFETRARLSNENFNNKKQMTISEVFGSNFVYESDKTPETIEVPNIGTYVFHRKKNEIDVDLKPVLQVMAESISSALTGGSASPLPLNALKSAVESSGSLTLKYSKCEEDLKEEIIESAGEGAPFWKFRISKVYSNETTGALFWRQAKESMTVQWRWDVAGLPTANYQETTENYQKDSSSFPPENFDAYLVIYLMFVFCYLFVLCVTLSI